MIERFYTIRFKRHTAQRFKQFSKRVGKTYSHTLEAVMDFFEWHGFVPSDRMDQSFLQEILKNQKLTQTAIKRTEASIAIIRDIEITQTKPTNAILEALLQQKERLMDKMGMLKKESHYVVENITMVKPSFGKPYLRLDITEGELENYKRTLQNL